MQNPSIKTYTRDSHLKLQMNLLMPFRLHMSDTRALYTSHCWSMIVNIHVVRLPSSHMARDVKNDPLWGAGGLSRSLTLSLSLSLSMCIIRLNVNTSTPSQHRQATCTECNCLLAGWLLHLTVTSITLRRTLIATTHDTDHNHKSMYPLPRERTAFIFKLVIVVYLHCDMAIVGNSI